MYLREGKKHCAAAVRRLKKTKNKNEKNSLSNTKVREGGEEVACNLSVGHGETDCPPAAHEGPQWRRYPHCSLWRTHTRADEHALEEAAAHEGLMQEQWLFRGACAESGLLAGPATPQRTHAGAVCS